MFTFTATADSITDLKIQMQRALEEMGGPLPTGRSPIVHTPPPKPADIAPVAEQPIVSPAAKEEVTKKRTRRTKEQIEADKAAQISKNSNGATDVFATKQHDTKAEEAPTPEAVKPAGAPVVNKEAVHNALQQVNVTVGFPKAREILAEFKVNRISEIKETDFKAFIDKCNEAVMSS